MENRKVTSYILYALGEIILVVIGILIAVQINNWNEERKAQQEITNYLINLKSEVEGNRVLLQENVAISKRVLAGARELADLLQEDLKSSPKTSMLLSGIFAPVLEYQPNLSVMNEMIASGAIRNLQNEDLKEKILGFQSLLTGLHIQENYHTQDYVACADYLMKHGNVRTVMDETGFTTNILKIKEAESRGNYDTLLQSQVFENRLIIFIASGVGLQEAYYVPMLEYIDSLLTALENEINT